MELGNLIDGALLESVMRAMVPILLAAFGEHLEFQWPWLEFAAVQPCLACFIHEPLGDVQAIACAFGCTHQNLHAMLGGCAGNGLNFRAVEVQRLLPVALTEAALISPADIVQPDPPRVSRQPELRKGDEFRAGVSGLDDQRLGLFDGPCQVQVNGGGLHHASQEGRMHLNAVNLLC